LKASNIQLKIRYGYNKSDQITKLSRKVHKIQENGLTTNMHTIT